MPAFSTRSFFSFTSTSIAPATRINLINRVRPLGRHRLHFLEAVGGSVRRAKT